MSTLLKKIKLFGKNGQPVVYRQVNGRTMTPTPRLNRRSVALGIVTSRNLTNARSNDERAYLRDVTKYFLMIKNYEESLKFMKVMSAAEKRAVLSALTVDQIVGYIGHFAKRSPMIATMAKKMSKKDLVDVAVGLA